MSRGKSINLFLMDGDVNGRIKCTLANWTGLAFKIPRTSLDQCKDRPELKQTGVYFLFGQDDQENQHFIYVGQAGVRKNGEGILNRLQEHNKNPKKDYWTEAIALTTSNDSMGPTEISYLEHRFYTLAVAAGRYIVKNGNDPTPGNPTEEKISELEDFIDNAKIIVGTLGHKAFEPLTVSGQAIDSPAGQLLYCTQGKANATGKRTSDGFVVLAGSQISDTVAKSCPPFALKKREQLKDSVVDSILQSDVLFNTPSGASDFVCGSSTSGWAVWKTADGTPLKELLD